MKWKTIRVLAGLSGALIADSPVTADVDFTLVSLDQTSPFLVANGLVSAVVGISGFAPGENFQGLIGAAYFPFQITTSAGTFFNVDSNGESFDGQWQTAANSVNAPPYGAFDTGVLANPITNALGAISSETGYNPIGFAQYGVGQNTGSGAMFWLTLNPNGLPVSGTVNLFRLTWSATAVVHVQADLITNTGGGQGNGYHQSIDIDPAPAPSALGVLAVAGLVGGRRRR